jgi:hypothetical protein
MVPIVAIWLQAEKKTASAQVIKVIVDHASCAEARRWPSIVSLQRACWE